MATKAKTSNRSTLAGHLVARFGTDAPAHIAPLIAKQIRDWACVVQSPRLLEDLLKKFQVPFHYTQHPRAPDGRHGDAYLRFVDGVLSLEIDRASFRSNRGRARFSIAHEIAHIALIHIFGNEVIRWSEESPAAYREVENLCDQVASHILMPRILLRNHFRENGFNTFSIHLALKVFGVSKQALLTGIADTQSKMVAFNFRKFARNPEENADWRIANNGSASDVGTAPPWKARGSTVAKHLIVDVDLENLEPDRPWVGEALWTAKNRQLPFQAILCKMDVVDASRIEQFVIDEVADYSRVKQDVFDGIVALLGPKDRQDVRAFFQ